MQNRKNIHHRKTIKHNLLFKELLTQINSRSHMNHPNNLKTRSLVRGKSINLNA